MAGDAKDGGGEVVEHRQGVRLVLSQRRRRDGERYVGVVCGYKRDGRVREKT